MKNRRVRRVAQMATFGLFAMLIFVSLAFPTWLDTAEQKRIPLNVSSANIVNYSNFQLNVSLDLPEAKTNGSDLRFSYYNATANTETNLSFWRDPATWNYTTAAGVVYINATWIGNNTNSTYYVYYNGTVPDGSDGFKTFPIFDDFDNCGTRWSNSSTGTINFTSAVAIAGCAANLTGAGANDRIAGSWVIPADGFIIEKWVRPNSTAGNWQAVAQTSALAGTDWKAAHIYTITPANSTFINYFNGGANPTGATFKANDWFKITVDYNVSTNRMNLSVNNTIYKTMVTSGFTTTAGSTVWFHIAGTAPQNTSVITDDYLVRQKSRIEMAFITGSEETQPAPPPSYQNCDTLGAAGTYNLSQNLTNSSTCFTITAANVQINCSGYSITGNNASTTYGIYSDQLNTTVLNCNIQNFQHGVYLNGAHNSTILHSIGNSTALTGSGFYIYGSSSVSIINTTGQSRNWPGIFMRNGDNDCRILNSTGLGFQGEGINFFGGNNNQINNVTANNTGNNPSTDCQSGLVMCGSGGCGGFSTQYNNISNSIFWGCGEGLKFDTSHNNEITNVTATSKNWPGLLLRASTNNRVSNSRFIGIDYGNDTGDPSYGEAIELESGFNNISNSNATSKWVALRLILGASNNIFTNLSLKPSNGMGVSMEANSNNNRLLNSIINSTANRSINISGSANNTFLNNVVQGTVWVNDAATSNFYNNTNSGNAYYHANNTPSWSVGNGSQLQVASPPGYSSTGYPVNATNFPGFWIGAAADFFAYTNNPFPAPASNVSCQNLSTPNTNIVMNGTIASSPTTCFNVTAANVSIDCAGWTIPGENVSTSYGVLTNASNTTVKNCIIQNFDTGIYYFGGDNGTITNNTVYTTFSNGGGIHLFDSVFTTISNSYVNSKSYIALWLEQNTNNATITNVTAVSTTQSALYAVSSASNVINYSNLTSTSGTSVYLDIDTQYNSFNNNTFFSGNATAIYMVEPTFQTILGNIFLHNNITAATWVNLNSGTNVFNDSNSGNIYYFTNGFGAWTVYSISCSGTPPCYADTGSDRPFNNHITQWIGGGSDYFPYSGIISPPLQHPAISPSPAYTFSTLNFNTTFTNLNANGKNVSQINWTIYQNGNVFATGTNTSTYTEASNVNLANIGGFPTGASVILQVQSKLTDNTWLSAANSTATVITTGGIFLCNSTINTPTITYYFKDANSPSSIVNATMTAIYSVGGTQYIVSTTNSTIYTCINPYSASFTATANENVNASGYTSRSLIELPQVYSNVSINRTIYLTNSSLTPYGNVLFTVQTTSGAAFVGYTIRIEKYDSSTNSYLFVDSVTTDSLGQASSAQYLQTPKYNLTVFDTGGNVVDNEPNLIFCQDGTTPCVKRIILGGGTPNYYGNTTQIYTDQFGQTDYGNSSFTGGGFCTWNNVTYVITCQLTNTTNNANNISLVLSNGSINNHSIITSANSTDATVPISISVPAIKGVYNYQFLANYNYNQPNGTTFSLNYQKEIEAGTVIILRDAPNPYGKDGWIAAFLLVIVVALTASWGAAVMVLAAGITVLASGFLGLIYLSPITAGSILVLTFVGAMWVKN